MSFGDIDPQTLTLSPKDAADAIGIGTSALLAVHTFGVPCDVDALAELSERSGIALLFDAALASLETVEERVHPQPPCRHVPAAPRRH